MERTEIKDLPSSVGSRVKIVGFVDTIRNQKKTQFIVVRDRTGKIQAVAFREEQSSQVTKDIDALTVESAIEVVGLVVEAPAVKLKGIELQIETLKVYSKAETPLPIRQDSSLEKQMDWRALSLRHPEKLLIFRVQTTIEWAMRDFWRAEGFLEIHSPKLMGVASESGAELFSLKYFEGKTAYLAQSPQFYKQMAMAAGFEKVFEIGPVFRANPSFTSRHDTEFTSVDMEVAWISDYSDLIRLEEQWIIHILKAVRDHHAIEIKKYFDVDVTVPSSPFPRISLADARIVLEGRGHYISHKADLDPAGERLLSEYILERYGHEFVFVTEYPAAVRAFYHMRPSENQEVTSSFDLLWKGLEITTGAQREHRLDVLTAQATEKGLDLLLLENYLSFFRYGCPPHGGMGVGLTRLLMVLLGISNVREVTYLYRGPNRLSP